MTDRQPVPGVHESSAAATDGTPPKPVGWAQFYIDGTIIDFSDDPGEVAGWDGEGLPVKPLFEHPPVPSHWPVELDRTHMCEGCGTVLHHGGHCDCSWNRRLVPRVDVASAEPPAPSSQTTGIELAARFVEKRRDDYVREHGSYDCDTGFTEFPGDGLEYVGELDEIIEGIRALATSEGSK